MSHLVLVFFLLSFVLSVSVQFLFIYLYTIRRVKLIRNFIFFQGFLILFGFLMMSYRYIDINVQSPVTSMIVWYSVSFLLAPLFGCFYIYFFHYLTGTGLPAVGKTSVVFAAVMLTLSGYQAYFTQKTAADILRQMETNHYFFIMSASFLCFIYILVLLLLGRKRVKNQIVRTMIRFYLGILIFYLPLMAVVYLTNPVFINFKSGLMTIFVDLFFLLINILHIGVFIILSKKTDPKLFRGGHLGSFFSDIRKAGGAFSISLKKYEKSNLSRETAEQEIGKIRDFMMKQKPYLDSELSLVQLAEKLAIPRNRLSQILNEYFHQNFYDFLNSYRVDEVKTIMRNGGETNNFLHSAFAAGFNSKATFYTAFKRLTGMNPSEYQSSLQSKK